MSIRQSNVFGRDDGRSYQFTASDDVIGRSFSFFFFFLSNNNNNFYRAFFYYCVLGCVGA